VKVRHCYGTKYALDQALVTMFQPLTVSRKSNWLCRFM